jgi:hypothetical protein
MNPILYSNENSAAEQTYRGNFMDSLKTHKSWYEPEMRAELLASKTFSLSAISMQILKQDRENKKLIRLKEIIKVPDIYVFARVKKLIQESKRSNHDEKWLVSAIQLVQVSVGSRWIEVTNVTNFELSQDDKYPSETYIVCQGLAKSKREPKIVENPNGDILEEMENDDDLEVDSEGLIVKPCLWGDYGISPKFIVNLVSGIRSYLSSKLGKKLTNSVNDMKSVRERYLGKTIADFDKLWLDSGIRFLNKTHTWRKIYGSDSNSLYNRDGNLNLWLMQVLGHVRLETSFNYANVVVVNFVTLQDEDLKFEYSRLKNDYEELAKFVEKQQEINDFLLKRSNPSAVPKESISSPTVEVPSLLGGKISVVPFDIPNQKFTDEKDRIEWQENYMKTVKEALKNVDISQLTDNDWSKLKVNRNVGRTISRLSRVPVDQG